MDWDDLRVMLACAREGSASRAAGVLGVTVSTVTRRLSHLEEACGAPLFARTPDGVRLTEAGAALLPHAEAAERAVLAATAAVEAVGTEPAGEVTVTLPFEVLCLVVLPQLPAFQAQFPDVRITWISGPEILDLPRREADIAVRTWRPVDDIDALLTRRVRTVPVAAYGSAEYLATVDDPTDPAAHRWIASRYPQDPLSSWVRGIGGPIHHHIDNPFAMRLAVACGLGASPLASIFAELVPGLVRLELACPAPDPFDVFLVTHRAVRHAPAVAAVWEFLIEAVGGTTEADDAALLDGFQRRYFRSG